MVSCRFATRGRADVIRPRDPRCDGQGRRRPRRPQGRPRAVGQARLAVGLKPSLPAVEHGPRDAEMPARPGDLSRLPLCISQDLEAPRRRSCLFCLGHRSPPRLVSLRKELNGSRVYWDFTNYLAHIQTCHFLGATHSAVKFNRFTFRKVFSVHATDRCYAWLSSG